MTSLTPEELIEVRDSCINYFKGEDELDPMEVRMIEMKIVAEYKGKELEELLQDCFEAVFQKRHDDENKASFILEEEEREY